jgi:ZIP family zinc transporter
VAAFGWGALAASSLLVGAVIAMTVQVRLRTIGLVMGFGSGALISAVSFDLIEEATGLSTGHGAVLLGLFGGCATFFVGDVLIYRLGGANRKDASGAQQSGNGLAIVLGTVLDGIPESIVIGLTINKSGAVGAAYLTAVFISNVPEALASTSGLLASGWRRAHLLTLWSGIVLVSAIASLAGYTLFKDASASVVAAILAFAGGSILTMLADTMMPEAYEHGGKLVGVVTTLGFAVALAIDLLD